MENFEEYFNARPLFEDLYEKINTALKACMVNEANHPRNDHCPHKSVGSLKKKLITLSRRTAARQIALLSRVGLVSDRIHIKENCKSSTYIPLFQIKEKGEMHAVRDDLKMLFENMDKNGCAQYDEGSMSTVSGGAAKGYGVGAAYADDAILEDELHEENSEWWNDSDNITLKTERRSKKKFHAIKIKVKKIDYPEVEVEVNLYEYKRENGKPVMRLKSERPFTFSASYFDMPYMDNTRIFDGERFALVLKAICTKDCVGEDDCKAWLDNNRHIEQLEAELIKAADEKDDKKEDDLKEDIRKLKEHMLSSSDFAVFQVITFKEEFMSLRDRPLFEDMLHKLKADS